MSGESRVIIKQGLHRARVSAGLSQAEVCRLLSGERGLRVDQSDLSKLERGVRAGSPDLVAALAHVLDVPVADLIDARTDAEIRQGVAPRLAPADLDLLEVEESRYPAKPKAKPKATPAAKRTTFTTPASVPLNAPDPSTADEEPPSSSTDALQDTRPASGDDSPSTPDGTQPVAVEPPTAATTLPILTPLPPPNHRGSVVVVQFDQATELLHLEIPAGQQVTLVPVGPTLTVQVGGGLA